ncbi:hypothetical protein OH77DRAFT_1428306 [Trametes cingulata]|nr:hypothetical protein OH77DRAFT_1428306 [Trametes cingulata]
MLGVPPAHAHGTAYCLVAVPFLPIYQKLPPCVHAPARTRTPQGRPYPGAHARPPNAVTIPETVPPLTHQPCVRGCRGALRSAVGAHLCFPRTPARLSGLRRSLAGDCVGRLTTRMLGAAPKRAFWMLCVADSAPGTDTIRSEAGICTPRRES